MNEIVQQVARQTGLSEEMAAQVVTTVVETLKERLPAPIASQIDAALQGGAAAPSIGQAAASLGSLFQK